MKPDGSALLDDGRLVFDGTQAHPTIEGPKMYKRAGYYYIFAPAGGVPRGWQTVLRSGNIYGPYEDKIVMAQGKTDINGPHQGGWVELESGEGWFVHFQDRGAYGRIVHLQPLRWSDNWPLIGEDRGGVGEPVAVWNKPNMGKVYPVAAPQTSDEFDAEKLGLQWQWHANPQLGWMSLTANPGKLRLCSAPVSVDADLARVPNLLLQKFPAPAFTVTTRVTVEPELVGEQTGLVVMGRAYAYLGLRNLGERMQLIQVTSIDGDSKEVENADWQGKTIYLRVEVREQAVCRFSFSADAQDFKPIGTEFQAREGGWIGAKVGLFCINPCRGASRGFADFDWFRFDE
jgi:beta-xylosidase